MGEVEKQKSASSKTGAVRSLAITEADQAIWLQVFDGHKGEKLQQLFEGDISVSNNDHSQAIIDLGNALAYYTKSDAEQIRRMFYQTQLIRPKWREKRGELSWIDYQIQDCIGYLAKRQQAAGGE